MTSPSSICFDRKFRKCLAAIAKAALTPSQRNNASIQLKELTSEAEGLGFARLIGEVGNFFLTRQRLKELGQPGLFPTQQLIELGRHGLAATLEFGIAQSPKSFSELPVEVLLQEVSSSALLNKIATARKRLLTEALVTVQKQPGSAKDFAGLPWVIGKAKIDQLFPLLPVIFAQEEQSTGAHPISFLRSLFLSRDKAGKGIAEIVARVSTAELSKDSLIQGLKQSPEASVIFLRLLPKVLLKGLDGSALSILEGWLPSLPDVSVQKRAIVSGALAVLCGELIKKPKRRLAEETAISLVTGFIRQLSLQIGVNLDGYWGLFPLGESLFRGSDKP